MEVYDVLKRMRRIFDGNYSKRRMGLIMVVLVIFLYIGNIILRWMSQSFYQVNPKEPLHNFLSYRLQTYVHRTATNSYDVNLLHNPPLEDEKPFLPFVGNGHIGVVVSDEDTLLIKHNRLLELSVPYQLLASVDLQGMRNVEATISDYKNGNVNQFKVWGPYDGEFIESKSEIYAHRTMPSIFVQDIKLTNPSSSDISVEIRKGDLDGWKSSTHKYEKILVKGQEHQYSVVSGSVNSPASDKFIVVSIVSMKLPTSITVMRKSSSTLKLYSSVNYSEPIPSSMYHSTIAKTEKSSLEALRKALSSSGDSVRDDHVSAWGQLWHSGFQISLSKAENALNGDLINATIYYILSQVRSPLHEVQTSASEIESLTRDLSYPEGCYDGHHTLQAQTLWSTLHTLQDINRVVYLWLMTLEKQGCYQLLRAGADGVMQAMLLSFGGLQFSNQHLQFNMDPSHLHRDYFFRRISYGKKTHVNVSVVVQEDYKAALYVSVDRADENYYGCDAGCLDPPVKLGPHAVTFPVKKTQPLTAILYITFDRVHMEELKHAIHVQEVAIAPPHEHNIIAIHKHGHRFGGFPTFFWFSVVSLIVVFHLFLFKIVISEFCGTDVRVKYRKLSDFD